jgi:hypothetical protein
MKILCPYCGEELWDTRLGEMPIIQHECKA